MGQQNDADKWRVQQLTRPLFRFDPGWMFIAAGLSVCAAVMIVPVQTDLNGLRAQLDQLRNEETRAYARLKAHSDFMDQVDRADPALIRRLAATQLNMVPEGDTPVLLAASASVPVTHWIEAAVKVDMRPPKSAPDTMLSKLVNGPYRLWIFGAGIMAVFFGVLLGTTTVNARRAAALPEDLDADELFASDVDSSCGLALAVEEVDAANELLTAEQVSGVNEIPLQELADDAADRNAPADDQATREAAVAEPDDASAVLTVESKATRENPAKQMAVEVVADVVQDVQDQIHDADAGDAADDQGPIADLDASERTRKRGDEPQLPRS